jgi:hypothetical protein
VTGICNLIKEHLRSGNVVQMDEIAMTVKDEPGRENSPEKLYVAFPRKSAGETGVVV